MRPTTTGRRRGRAVVRVLQSTPARVAGTAIGVVLLLHGVDAGAALRSLAGVDASWLLAAMLLTAVAYALSVVEWGVLLRAASGTTSWRRIGTWQVQSVFVGSVVPGGAGGDALRALHATRVAGSGRGVASLLCSRMAGSCGMAAWALAGAFLLRARFGWITVGAAAVLVALICVGWLVALFAAPLLHRSRHRAVALVVPLTDALRWFRDRGDALCVAIASGVLGWTINLLSLAALARAVGVDAGPELFAVAIPLSLLTTLVPFAVSGIGLREGVLVGLLVHAGVDAHRAAALAVLVDLQPIPVALAGAALWLGERNGRSDRSVRTGAEAAALTSAA